MSTESGLSKTRLQSKTIKFFCELASLFDCYGGLFKCSLLGEAVRKYGLNS